MAKQVGVVANARTPLIVMVLAVEHLPEYMTIQQVRTISGLSDDYISLCRAGAEGYPLLQSVTLPGNTYSHVRRADYEAWIEKVRKGSRTVVPGARISKRRRNGQASANAEM